MPRPHVPEVKHVKPKNHFAYVAAYVRALRSGLDHDARDDCAIAFLEQEWAKAGGLEKLNVHCQDSPALARKCGADFMSNFSRHPPTLW